MRVLVFCACLIKILDELQPSEPPPKPQPATAHGSERLAEIRNPTRVTDVNHPKCRKW